MRVTGGTARSRKIKAPRGPHVEPVPDMVREAVFSILAHVVGGARVLDLFACSGSLGIEALSRGAQSVLFIEKDLACARIITENLETLDMTSNGEVLVRDALTVLPYLRGCCAQFDLAFVDPPYSLSENPQTAKKLERLIVGLFNSPVLTEGAVIVFRQRKGSNPLLTDDHGLGRDTRTYGTTQVTFIERS